MAAGFRSLLAPWAGGAGALPVSTHAGFRSPFAIWTGGAGARTTQVRPGFRSPFAFWVGGAGALAAVTPPEPTRRLVLGGGAGSHGRGYLSLAEFQRLYGADRGAPPAAVTEDAERVRSRRRRRSQARAAAEVAIEADDFERFR